MTHVAEFVSSDVGRFYASTCERFGVDPAEGLPDVLALNLRAGMHAVAARVNRDQAERTSDDPLDKARAMERWVKTHGG